jgi:membrane protein required for colicin V production
MIGPLSYLDIGLIAVAFISGILAMYRGFTREMLSIISWAVAAGAVLYFVLFHRKFAEDMAAQTGTQVAIAQIAIGAFIFLIVLIVVHLITARLSESVLDSRVGMVDHILGFIFGVARGFLLVVIPFMFYQHFIPDETKHYDWVRNAQSLPYLKSTGESLQSVLVNYLPSSLMDPGTPEEAPATGEQQG